MNAKKLPMLSNMEQCADAVMRMRAEYLWDKGRYDSIHFHSVSGVDQRYSGGSDRKAFENYLRRVFDNSNTSSLRRELKEKPFQSTLYLWKDRYYLVIRSAFLPKDRYYYTIAEFARFSRIGKALPILLSEHAKCLAKGNAVAVIGEALL